MALILASLGNAESASCNRIVASLRFSLPLVAHILASLGNAASADKLHGRFASRYRSICRTRPYPVVRPPSTGMVTPVT